MIICTQTSKAAETQSTLTVKSLTRAKAKKAQMMMLVGRTMQAQAAAQNAYRRESLEMNIKGVSAFVWVVEASRRERIEKEGKR